MARRKTQSYTDDFKRQVVAQLRAGMYKREQIADAHDVSMGTLRNWEKKLVGVTDLPPAQPLPIPAPKAAASRTRSHESRAPMAARRSGSASPDLANINQEIADTQNILAGLLLRRAAAELSIQ